MIDVIDRDILWMEGLYAGKTHLIPNLVLPSFGPWGQLRGDR